MKSFAKVIAAGLFAVAASASVSSAENAMQMMQSKMQCHAACSSAYMQCVMAAQQTTSNPAEAMNQVKMNFEASTACGQASMSCNSGC